MKRLLIAVDGSAAADEAVRVGVEIAAGLGAAITFVHGDDELAAKMDEGAGTASLERTLALAPVLARAAKAARGHGVPADAELVWAGGTPDLVAAVLGIADAVAADLIVVGSRGRGPIAGAVLGSVSQGVLADATVPVLLTHAPRAVPPSRSHPKPPAV